MRKAGWWLAQWLKAPWRVFRLKRRAVAQRGTIIAQRQEIARLIAHVARLSKTIVSIDRDQARKERNRLRGSQVVGNKIEALNDENDELAAEVVRLRAEGRG